MLEISREFNDKKETIIVTKKEAKFELVFRGICRTAEETN